MSVNYFCKMLADHVTVVVINDHEEVERFKARGVKNSKYRWYTIDDWSFSNYSDDFAVVRLVLRK